MVLFVVFGFCFELCLLRFCFSLQPLFRFFYFEYCDSIVFQIVVLSCFHSRSHLFVFNVLSLFFCFVFRLGLGYCCPASKSEGEKGIYLRVGRRGNDGKALTAGPAAASERRGGAANRIISEQGRPVRWAVRGSCTSFWQMGANVNSTESSGIE